MTGEKRYKDFVQSMKIYRWSNGCNFESEKKKSIMGYTTIDRLVP